VSEISVLVRMEETMRDDRNALLQEVERMLRKACPTPDARFRAGLERRLLARGRRRLPAWPRLTGRPLLAGGLVAVAMASLVLAFSLAGIGPVAPTDDVRGSTDCRYVIVQRPGRVAEVVIGADGKPRLETRVRTLELRVKRCR
jgi:hypothetical protein